MLRIFEKRNCLTLVAFIGILVAEGVDVSVTVYPSTNQANGSPGTVTATISNVSPSFHVVTAYLNKNIYDNMIGFAELQGDFESCYNKSVSDIFLRCSVTEANSMKQHIVQVDIFHFKSLYHSIIWEIDHNIYHTRLHVTECGNVTLPGVVQNVPANKGYHSTHTFSCISPDYQETSQIAVCQANATWNVTHFCNVPTAGSQKNGLDTLTSEVRPSESSTTALDSKFYTPTFTETKPGSSQHSMSVVVGTVIGVAFALCLLIGFGFWMIKQIKKKHYCQSAKPIKGIPGDKKPRRSNSTVSTETTAPLQR